MPNATVRANAQALPEPTNRRAVLGAVLAAGAAAVIALPATASRAIAASEPHEDAALFALIAEAKAIDALQKEIDDAEEAAYDRMIRPEWPSALNPRPGDHFLVRPPPREKFHGSDFRNLRGLVESTERLDPASTLLLRPMVMEIKTRGREIVDAWDTYQADRERAKEAAGLPAINRRGARSTNGVAGCGHRSPRRLRGPSAECTPSSPSPRASLNLISGPHLAMAQRRMSCFRSLWITRTFIARRRRAHERRRQKDDALGPLDQRAGATLARPPAAPDCAPAGLVSQNAAAVTGAIW